MRLHVLRDQVIEMIRVFIEVQNDGTHFNVVTESGEEAARIAAGVYPNDGVRMRYPIDPEAFFVKDSAARAEIVGIKRPGEAT